MTAKISLTILLIVVLAVPSSFSKSVLYSPEIVKAGQSLTFGSYSFIIQCDCNLVLYESRSVIWATGTKGSGSNCYLKMQTDGNLVLYSDKKKAMWASNTKSVNDNYVLILQKDRNVVIYGRARWDTGTAM